MYKKILGILLLVSLLTGVNSAMGAGARLVFKVIGGSQSGVYCYQLKNGQPVSLGFKRPDDHGEGFFDVDIDQPTVYYIKKAGGKASVFRTVIYLRPGEQKKLTLQVGEDGVDFNPASIAPAGLETSELQQWLGIFNQLSAAAGLYDNHKKFFQLYPQVAEKANALKKNSKGEKAFKMMFAQMVDADLLYLRAAAFFYGNDRLNAKYDTSRLAADFYRPLENQKAYLGSANLLNSVHGVDLIRYALAYTVFKETGSRDSVLTVRPFTLISSIANDTLKGVYAASYVPGMTSYERLVQEIGPFERFFYGPALKENYHHKKDQLARFAIGRKAYNFKLKDVNSGKIVQLSDFKGKVVVADLWAMWCAPCLAERPRFMEIEEAYKDRQDIVFLGISVDGLSRETILKGFLVKKNWNGIELESNFDESVMKYYGIEGIPRFMIFDRSGNIFNVDAPRPSDAQFEIQIKQALDGKE